MTAKATALSMKAAALRMTTLEDDDGEGGGLEDDDSEGGGLEDDDGEGGGLLRV